MNILPYIICKRINDIYITKDVFTYINHEQSILLILCEILSGVPISFLIIKILCIEQWLFIIRYIYFKFRLNNKAKNLYHEGFTKHGVFKIMFNKNIDKAFKFNIYKYIKKRNKYINKIIYKIKLSDTNK